MKILSLLLLSIALTSCCNLSFSNVMTDGTASDVIDDTDAVTSDPNIAPELSIPASLI